MQVPFTTLSEAADMTADYLRREARENCIEQGYPDPFPEDEDLWSSDREDPSDDDRLRWLSAISTKEDDMYENTPYDGVDERPRLVEKFGNEFISHISHITPVTGRKLPSGWTFYEIAGGERTMKEFVNVSELWSTAFGAVRNWYDVLDFAVTPRGRGLWVYLKPDVLSTKELELVKYVLPELKAIRVCVHGDIVQRAKDMFGL